MVARLLKKLIKEEIVRIPVNQDTWGLTWGHVERLTLVPAQVMGSSPTCGSALSTESA